MSALTPTPAFGGHTLALGSGYHGHKCGVTSNGTALCWGECGGVGHATTCASGVFACLSLAGPAVQACTLLQLALALAGGEGSRRLYTPTLATMLRSARWLVLQARILLVSLVSKLLAQLLAGPPSQAGHSQVSRPARDTHAA